MRDRGVPIARVLGGVDIDVPDQGLKTLRAMTPEPLADRFEAAYFLIASVIGKIVLMLPVTRVYIEVKQNIGFQQNFVVALMGLPVVATSVVLLIQDSLPLAFGLAALVAAVRFRVQLKDALDGIFVFAAVGVGLASGVGYLGVAYVMTVFSVSSRWTRGG